MTELNGWIGWLKIMTYKKNIILIGIKSALIYKKLIASLSTVKNV